MKILAYTFSLLLLAALPTAAGPSNLWGKVVAIHDGDTLTLLTPAKAQLKIRLAGIDCPESGQAFGQKAKQALSEKVFGKSVKVVVTDTDRYSRSVGDVYLGPTWINLEMVAEGWAWHYVQYSKAPELAAAQKAARAASRGRRSLRQVGRPPRRLAHHETEPPVAKGHRVIYAADFAGFRVENVWAFVWGFDVKKSLNFMVYQKKGILRIALISLVEMQQSAKSTP